MTQAPALAISLPGAPYNNLPTYLSAPALRAVLSTTLSDGYQAVIAPGALLATGAVFQYSPSSLAIDDGMNVLRPVDLSASQMGRWLGTPYVKAAGPSGQDGATGPAANTFTSLSNLKALDPAVYPSAILADGTNPPVSYAYVAGNFTDADDEVNVVKLDVVPLSTGALVRQAATSVTFKSSATGTVRRDQNGKSDEVRSVVDFGAAPGVECFAALQAAVNWCCVRQGHELLWPAGTWLTSQPLVIQDSDNWQFRGASRGTSAILQVSDNKPTFQFVGGLTHSWAMSHLTIGHLTAQPFANKMAIGICFDGTAQGSIFNWSVDSCTFQNSYRGMTQTNRVAQQAVWGVKVSKCVGQGNMSGAFLYLVPSPSVGQPRITIDNCYIDSFSSAPNESSIGIGYCDNVSIREVEFNRGTLGAGCFNLFITGSTGCVIASKSEDVGTQVQQAAIWMIEQSNTALIGCRLNGLHLQGGSNVGIQGVTGSTLSFINYSFGVADNAGLATPYRVDGASQITSVSGLHIEGPSIVADPRKIFGPGTGIPLNDLGARFCDGVIDVGDNDYNSQNRGPVFRVYRYNTTLTTDRRFQLPDATAVPDGAELMLVRDASTAGAFSLNVEDDNSGRNYQFTANARGSVTYKSVSQAWMIVATSVFASS